MSGTNTRTKPGRRVALITALLAAAVSLPALAVSVAADAQDDRSAAAFRLYFAIPFIASAERKPTRLGVQLLSEFNDGAAYQPLPTDRKLDAAVDLGFTREGLAKFDVVGADMRSAYEVFARAIGLTPDEVELCRQTDCLDWVKPSQPSTAPAPEMSQDW